MTRVLVSEPVPYDLYTDDPITVQQTTFIYEVGVESIKVVSSCC